MGEQPDLKLKTARTLKWNTVDKFASQLLYAVTGVVLANVLSKEDFGLVGAMLVFQAFASLFVDSGFSSALIQKKNPDDSDYCTIFYFNLAMSIGIYIILWFCAPLIADAFGDERLVDLSRVMFLSFIISATAIVQTNRLMKQMTVAKIAISNTIGLVISGGAGIWLALAGYGAWAIVWQTLILGAVKSAILWATSGWLPRKPFSMASFRSVVGVGTGVMASSFLNTLSLNIYSYVIGVYYNLTQLGCYTQADKWSKMGVMSISQILTSSFLPVLSGCQNEPERHLNMMRKMNRFTSYISLPAMLFLMVSATSIFHILFGTKWDEAIILFQILALRGVFVIFAILYSNFILSLGKAKAVFHLEIVKDVLMIAAIFITIPFGVEAIVWGQLASSVLFFVYAIFKMRKDVNYPVRHILGDLMPYVVESIVIVALLWLVGSMVENAWLCLFAQLVVGAVAYFGVNKVMHSHIQKEVMTYAFGRFLHRK